MGMKTWKYSEEELLQAAYEIKMRCVGFTYDKSLCGSCPFEATNTKAELQYCAINQRDCPSDWALYPQEVIKPGVEVKHERN